MPANGAGAAGSGASSGLREEAARGRGAGAAGDSAAGLEAGEMAGGEEGFGSVDARFLGISGMARDVGLGGSFLTSSFPTPARLVMMMGYLLIHPMPHTSHVTRHTSHVRRHTTRRGIRGVTEGMRTAARADDRKPMLRPPS